MSQVSRPVQIVLLLTVVFGAAWFFMLRPKPAEPAPPPPAPTKAPTDGPQSSFGGAVETAKNGRGQAEGSAAERDAASNSVDNPTAGKTDPSTAAPSKSPGTQPGKGGPNAPAAKVKADDLPKPVARALDKRKVVLILFWNRSSTDDRAVRAELRRVDRRKGRVYVTAAPLSQLGRYGAITRGVQVLQSPTLVVIDRQRRASTLIGYTDAREIDQRVSDVLNGRSAPVETAPAPPAGAAPPAGTTP
jgi:hypothetical protein